MRHILVVVLLVATLAPYRRAGAETVAGTPILFKETGHTLAYTFRLFWDQQGGLPIFGYPITEVFIEQGRPVQYLERARLEWHADLGVVLVGHLGRWAAEGSAGHPAFAAVARASADGSDYVVETGHTLGGAFKEFWYANGGLHAFGFPLSEEFQEVNREDGRTYTVQYFERARFEWHPDLPPAHQVQLGHMGRQYLQSEQSAPEWARTPVSGPERAWDGVRPTRIRMPRIDLDTEIVEGGFSLRGWDVARYTAVHYWPVAGFPGTPGNITIAGHVGYRDTIFNHLPTAAVGDDIVLSIDKAERRYRVTEILTVLPSDSWVMAPTRDETLTLITCVPIGVYSHRLIVRATPAEP